MASGIDAQVEAVQGEHGHRSPPGDELDAVANDHMVVANDRMAAESSLTVAER